MLVLPGTGSIPNTIFIPQEIFRIFIFSVELTAIISIPLWVLWKLRKKKFSRYTFLKCLGLATFIAIIITLSHFSKTTQWDCDGLKCSYYFKTSGK